MYRLAWSTPLRKNSIPPFQTFHILYDLNHISIRVLPPPPPLLVPSPSPLSLTHTPINPLKMAIFSLSFPPDARSPALSSPPHTHFPCPITPAPA